MYNLYNKDLDVVKEFIAKQYDILKKNNEVDCGKLDDEQLSLVTKVFMEMAKPENEVKEKFTKVDTLNFQMALQDAFTGIGGI